MDNYNDIIIKLLTTEKTTLLKENSTYVFKVAKNANKILVKKTVEDYFSVKVKNINIVNVKPKKKESMGRRRRVGVVSGFKKAYVTLEKGVKISSLEI